MSLIKDDDHPELKKMIYDALSPIEQVVHRLENNIKLHSAPVLKLNRQQRRKQKMSGKSSYEHK